MIALTELIFILAIAALAYYGKDRPMFIISGLAFIVYGFDFTSTNLYFSILLVLAGIFMFFRAFSNRGMRA